MCENIKVVYNEEVYLPLKLAIEQTGQGIKIFQNDGVKITKIKGMGKVLFVKEADLQKYDNNIKTIVFSIQDKLKNKYKMHFQAASLVHAFMGIEISKDDLIDKVKEEAEKEVSNTVHWLKKNYEEAKRDKENSDKVNDILDKLDSKLRIKQFLTISDGLKIRNDLFLCGNGYFKKIFNIYNIVIPISDYCNWEHWENKQERIDFMNDLDKNYLYIFDENGDSYNISLLDNFNDEINYDTDYFNVIEQAFDKNKDIKTENFCVDWTDFNTEDERIEFDIEDDDLKNMFLLTHGQKPIKKTSNKYDITLEKLENIIKRLN